MVRFTFDGREYEGLEGEPLAVALLAANRRILSRSFRFHRPRGLMCSTGSCGWCECEVDGVPSVRSCQVPVRAGLVARGEHALPSVERDLLSLTGLVSRWIPPTFYHHRFLRPRALRKRSLDVLRWFGGRGRLAGGERPAPVGRPTRRIEPDVLIVGGGRAGLLAALGATEAGARVVLMEAEPALGGRWRVDVGDDRPSDAVVVAELVRDATAAGVNVLPGVEAVGWYDGTVAAIGHEAHYEIRAGAVVAATGSYDRVPLLPGADRPGVMAARAVVWLVERHGVLPGERALLVGAGQELASAAASLARAGATVINGPVPTASLLSIRGRRGVTGAVIRTDGTDRRVSVDLVVFGDRSPNLDLALAASAAVERRGDVLAPIVDAMGRTSVAGLLVAGSAAGLAADGVDEAAAARATGRGAAAQARGKPTAAPPDHRRADTGVRPPPSSGVARGAMVCFCEDVRAWEIRAERAAGYDDPELIKRRTGALTGPCQGKQCLQSFACLVGDSALPTTRPPLRAVRLGDLVASDKDAGASR
jgi:sarcosine oxidase, subunit alpha